ncbi:MAG: HNH endonuclease [Actinomycetota bacterium]|nr:HNH endonuclease [Actinomycetota bacterium]
MFEGLAEEIDELEVPADGAAITAAVALCDRLEAKIASAVGAFDAASLWDLDAATSMTAWLRHHAGMTRKDAARSAGLGRRLRQLPVTSGAWESGQIGSGQAHAVLAALEASTLHVFAGHEAALVPSLVGLSVTDTASAMAHWKAHAEGVAGGAEPPEQARGLHLSQTLGGAWAMDGTLAPEGGEVVATALRLGTSEDAEAEPARRPAERRADALVDVCRFFLDHQRHRPGGRHRPHVNVVVDLDKLEAGRPGRVVDGPLLDGPGMQALLCDSALHRLVMTGRSAVLDYGTATRTIPAPLWNALVVRDEHCRFPGCDRPSSWCEGHHVIPVVDNGPTCLANLTLVCTRHHHRLHQPGWHAKVRPDATLEVTDPGGRHWSTAPPRAGPLTG